MSGIIVKRLQEGGEVWHHEPFYCSSVDIRYIVINAPTKQDAIEGVKNSAPKKYGDNLVLKEVSFDGYEDEAIMITANYSSRFEDMSSEESKDYDKGFTFATSGGTMRRAVPLTRISRIPVAAPDHEGINVNENLDVEGVDIVCPIISFSEVHFFSGTKITTKYKKQLAETTGKMNLKDFRGYKPGEVLFLGAEGSRKGTSRDDLWEISFKFSVQLEERDIKIGELALDHKVGWDYMWVNYGKTVENGKVKTYAKAIYVDRVYYPADFKILGIGTR
ncbi:MAG: hypothetical protein ACOYI9_13560 [Candidatus Hydrogenedentales bacterium]|jgi:hypothetical protein